MNGVAVMYECHLVIDDTSMTALCPSRHRFREYNDSRLFSSQSIEYIGQAASHILFSPQFHYNFGTNSLRPQFQLAIYSRQFHLNFSINSLRIYFHLTSFAP